MKKYLFLTVMILTLIACGKSKEDSSAEKAVSKKSIKTQVVKKELISAAIIGNGNFEPVNEAEQTGPVADVVKVYFKNGDRVKQGDLIIQLDDRTIKANYEKAKAGLMTAEAYYNKSKKFSEPQQMADYEGAKASMIRAKEALDKAKKGTKSENIAIAKANVTTAKKSYEQAKFNYDKNKKLYDEKLISEASYIQYETAYYQAKSSLESADRSLDLLNQGTDAEDIRSLEASYNQAKATYELSQKSVKEKIWQNDITSAESNYLVAKANYELAKKDYEDLTVRAKISGVISNLSVKPHEKTKDNTVLFYVIEDKKMEVSIGLNAVEAIKISNSSKAEIYVEDLKQSFNGGVEEISPSADIATKKFMIKVKIENADGLVKKGMYAKVNIFAEPREMLVVPKNAIVVKGLYKYVYKAENGKARQIKVEIGNATKDLQEIITDEIKQGDKIIIDGQHLLQDNDLVEEVK